MVTFGKGSINKAQIARVSPVLSIDTSIIKNDGTSYIKKYYYKLFCSGEVIDSDMFATQAEAEADRTAFIAGM